MRARAITRGAALLAVLVASVAGATGPPRGLSPEEAESLREGRGMGLARAADQNGYPGPRHVLDAADAGQLTLTAAQRSAVRTVFDAMAADARRLGARILAEEAGLEAAFQAARLGESELQARVERLAALYGQLRLVHLRAHLATRPLLDETQRRQYDALRGHAPAHTH